MEGIIMCKSIIDPFCGKDEDEIRKIIREELNKESNIHPTCRICKYCNNTDDQRVGYKVCSYRSTGDPYTI
jgi:hypothetical protein